MVMRPVHIATVLRSALLVSSLLANSTLGVDKTVDYKGPKAVHPQFFQPPTKTKSYDNIRTYTSVRKPTNLGVSLIHKQLKKALGVAEAPAGKKHDGYSVFRKTGRQKRFRSQMKSPGKHWKIQNERPGTKSEVRSKRRATQILHHDALPDDLEVAEQTQSLSYASPLGFLGGGLGGGPTGVGSSLADPGGSLSFGFLGGLGNGLSPLSASISPSFLPEIGITIGARPPVLPFPLSGGHPGGPSFGNEGLGEFNTGYLPSLPTQDFGELNLGSLGNSNNFNRYKIPADSAVLKDGSDSFLPEVKGRSNSYDVFPQLDLNPYQSPFQASISDHTLSLLSIHKEDKLKQLEKEVQRDLDLKDKQLTPEQRQTKAIYESIEGILHEPHNGTTSEWNATQNASLESLGRGSTFHEPNLETTSEITNTVESLNFQAGGEPRGDALSPPAIIHSPIVDALNKSNQSQNDASQTGFPITENTKSALFLPHPQISSKITATLQPTEDTNNSQGFKHPKISSTASSTALSLDGMSVEIMEDNFEKTQTNDFPAEIQRTSTNHHYSQLPEHTSPNSTVSKLPESFRSNPFNHSPKPPISFEKRPVPLGRPRLIGLPLSDRSSNAEENKNQPPPFGIPDINKDHNVRVTVHSPLQHQNVQDSTEKVHFVQKSDPDSSLLSEDHQSQEVNIQQSTGSSTIGKQNLNPPKSFDSSVEQMSKEFPSTEASKQHTETFRNPFTPTPELNHHTRQKFIHWYREGHGIPTLKDLNATEGTHFENKARSSSLPPTHMKHFKSGTKIEPHITISPLDSQSEIHIEFDLQPLTPTPKTDVHKLLSSEEIAPLTELKIPNSKPISNSEFESSTTDETILHQIYREKDLVSEEPTTFLNHSWEEKIILELDKGNLTVEIFPTVQADQTEIMIPSPPPLVSLPSIQNSDALEMEAHSEAGKRKDTTMLYFVKESPTRDGSAKLQLEEQDDIQVEATLEIPPKYELSGTFTSDFTDQQTSVAKAQPVPAANHTNLSIVLSQKETSSTNPYHNVKGNFNSLESGTTFAALSPQDILESRGLEATTQNEGNAGTQASQNTSPITEEIFVNQEIPSGDLLLRDVHHSKLSVEVMNHEHTNQSKGDPLFRETVEAATFDPIEKNSWEAASDHTMQTRPASNPLKNIPAQHLIIHHNTQHKNVQSIQRTPESKISLSHLLFPNSRTVDKQPLFHNVTQSVNSVLPNHENKTLNFGSQNILHFQRFQSLQRRQLGNSSTSDGQAQPVMNKNLFHLNQSQLHQTRDNLTSSLSGVTEIPTSSFYVSTTSKKHAERQNYEVEKQKTLKQDHIGKVSPTSIHRGSAMYFQIKSQKIDNFENRPPYVSSNTSRLWHDSRINGSRPLVTSDANQLSPKISSVKLSYATLPSSPLATHFEEMSHNSRYSHDQVSARHLYDYNLPLNNTSHSPIRLPNNFVITTENIPGEQVNPPTIIDDSIAKSELTRVVISEMEVDGRHNIALQTTEELESSSSTTIPVAPILETYTEAPFLNSSEIMTQLPHPLSLSKLSVIHLPHRFSSSYTTPARSGNFLPTPLSIPENVQENASLHSVKFPANSSLSTSEMASFSSTSPETVSSQSSLSSLVSPLISVQQPTILYQESQRPSTTESLSLLSEIPPTTQSPVVLGSDSKESDLLSAATKETESQIVKPILDYSPSDISSVILSEDQSQGENDFGFHKFITLLNLTTQLPQPLPSEALKPSSSSLPILSSSFLPLSTLGSASLSDLQQKLSPSHFSNHSFIPHSSDIFNQTDKPYETPSDDKDFSSQSPVETELSLNQEVNNVTIHKPDSYPLNINSPQQTASLADINSLASSSPLPLELATTQPSRHESTLSAPQRPSAQATKSSLLLSKEEHRKTIHFETLSDKVGRLIQNSKNHQNNFQQILASNSSQHSLQPTIMKDKNSPDSDHQKHYPQAQETEPHSQHTRNLTTLPDKNIYPTVSSTHQTQASEIPQSQHSQSEIIKQPINSVNHTLQLSPDPSQHTATDSEPHPQLSNHQNQYSQKIQSQTLVTPISQYSSDTQAVSPQPRLVLQSKSPIDPLSHGNSASLQQQLSRSLHSQHPKHLTLHSDQKAFLSTTEQSQPPHISLGQQAHLQQESIRSRKNTSHPKPQSSVPHLPIQSPGQPSQNTQYSASLQSDLYEIPASQYNHQRTTQPDKLTLLLTTEINQAQSPSSLEPQLPVTPQQVTPQYTGHSYQNQQQQQTRKNHNSLRLPERKRHRLRATTPKNQQDKQLRSRSRQASKTTFIADNSQPQPTAPERQHQLYINRQISRPSQRTQTTTRQNQKLRHLRTRLQHPRRHSETVKSQPPTQPTFHSIHISNQTISRPKDNQQATGLNGQQQRLPTRRKIKPFISRFSLGRLSDNSTKGNQSLPAPGFARALPSAVERRLTARRAGFKNHAKVN